MSKRLSFQALPVCPPPPVRRAFLTPACGFWDLGQGAKPGLHGDRSASPPASRPGRRVFLGDRAPRLRPDAPRAAWKQAVRANKAQPGGKAVSPKTNLCGSGSIGWAAAPSAVRTCPAAGWGEPTRDSLSPFSARGADCQLFPCGGRRVPVRLESMPSFPLPSLPPSAQDGKALLFS